MISLTANFHFKSTYFPINQIFYYYYFSHQLDCIGFLHFIRVIHRTSVTLKSGGAGSMIIIGNFILEASSEIYDNENFPRIC